MSEHVKLGTTLPIHITAYDGNKPTPTQVPWAETPNVTIEILSTSPSDVHPPANFNISTLIAKRIDQNMTLEVKIKIDLAHDAEKLKQACQIEFNVKIAPSGSRTHGVYALHMHALHTHARPGS